MGPLKGTNVGKIGVSRQTVPDINDTVAEKVFTCVGGEMG